MATVNTITTKVRNTLLDDPIRRTDAINQTGGITAAATVITVDDGEKFKAGDIIEVESETMLITESPRLADYLNEGSEVTNSDTTLTVTDGTKFAVNDIIKIDEEKIKVTAISTNNLTVTRGWEGTVATTHQQTTAVYIVDDIVVTRGFLGSTAATHADDISISIVDVFATEVIREGVKDGIKALYPFVYQDHATKIYGLANRRTVDDCDAANWTESGDASAEATDTSDKQEGTASLKLGATYSAGTATYTKTPTAFDASTYEYLNVWIYVKELKDSSEDYYLDRNALQLRIGSDATNYKYINIGRDQLREGKWTLISENLQDFTDQGTPVMTAVDYIAIVFNDLKNIASGDLKMDEWFLTTYPISTNKTQYRLPAGVFGINEVRLLDSGDNLERYTKPTDWMTATEDNYLVFKEYPEKEAKIIFLIGKKEFTVPSSNTTTLSFNTRFEPLVELFAAIFAIENFLNRRIDFTRYSGKLAERDSTVLDVIRLKGRLEDKYTSIYRRLEKGYGGVALNQDILTK